METLTQAAARVGMTLEQFLRYAPGKTSGSPASEKTLLKVTGYWQSKCPRCFDTGILPNGREISLIWLGVPPDEINWCNCETAERRKKYAHKIWANTLKRRIEGQFANAGIPPRFEELTLDSYPVSEGKEQALRLAREYLENGHVVSSRGPQNSILFYGWAGVGKTGLVTPIVKQWLEQGKVALFIEYFEFMAALQRCYGNKQEWQALMESAQGADLVVIDDLGRAAYQKGEKETTDKREKIYLLINHRHSHHLPTLFTTNLTPQQLGEYFEPRIKGRLIEMCAVCHVGGIDLRRYNGERQFKG